MRKFLLVKHTFILSVLAATLFSCTQSLQTTLYPVDSGWAQSSVNAVIFRINSIDSFEDTQVISYYDSTGTLLLAKRNLKSPDWHIIKTPYTGDVTNAHNAISIGFDGNGILHMVWGLHNAPMQYVQIEDLQHPEFPAPSGMTGINESSVTYPQFFSLENGNLLFMYRDGGSGHGNILLNRFETETLTWIPLHHPLIDGGGDLSPYPNPLVVDANGGWHLSWNWRETPDVASNHNLAYAFSPDEGDTWVRSDGSVYELPINDKNAGIVLEIPQQSDLINQTTMAVDSNGNPAIATYWRAQNQEAPQYHVVHYNPAGKEWQISQVGKRTLDFSLSGYGTRRIPIARPLLLFDDNDRLIMIFRDFERGGGVSAAIGNPPYFEDWNLFELYDDSVGLWEPTHDPTTWKRDGVLHLFHQFVGQGQAETLEDLPAQPISVLEWLPE